MKHTIRDFIIWSIGSLGISFLFRVYKKRNGPLVRVIAFHDVADGLWFEGVIKALAQSYHVVTPEQFHRNEFSANNINVLITFDDGYASWVDTCAQILKRHNLKALFFINSGLLNCAKNPAAVAEYMQDRLFVIPKLPLTWEEAQMLVAEGHSIGGHSTNHYNLATLNQDALTSEIGDDKKSIENQLSIVLTDFAYPFGRKNNYSTDVFEAAAEAGYTWQYSAVSAFSAIGNVIVPRTLVENKQSIESLKLWVEGSYDVVNFFR
jgi:peptidoglycan/xylan/chitin deacetylase (PgdA/CDA1 family)